MTIRNVTIGDKFQNGKRLICQVVDFHEVTSMTTKATVNYICIAQGIDSLAKNLFEVPFATVLRNKIKTT